MKVSSRCLIDAGARLRNWRVGVACLGVASVWGGWGAPGLQAQVEPVQWRGRVSTRVQYVEARTLVLDSVPIGAVSGSGRQRQVGDTLVTCATGATHCYFYRSGAVQSTYPSVLDADLNFFGFGLQGARAYVSARLRTDFGGDEFWPRTDDNFDLLAGYLELDRRYFRARIGRDYKVSGLGFYGYDGGSLVLRYPRARIEAEAYGGWGLERGVPEPIDGDAFRSLGVFQPLERNYLFGFRGSARPTRNSSISAIYQREIPTDRSGISSERLGFEASFYPTSDVSLLGHADYDLAAGWWGRAGATLGWNASRLIYVEGRLFRYRPVFSLQTIWVAFSPVAYSGWGLATRVQPGSDFSLRFEVERRAYGDTEAESPLLVTTTDRDWRLGGYASWRPVWGVRWDIDAGYWRNWGFGAALNSGNVRVAARPQQRLSLGARFSAFQQLEEFRVTEGRVWSLGADARWRTSAGTLWFSVDRFDHDRREDAAQTDWTQWRSALGFSYYLGSEPGRLP